MILFSSDNILQKKYIEKIGLVYLLISIFCALFGAIYEHFSHEVYSGYMIYAFAFPLVGGALPLMGMVQLRSPTLPGRVSLNLYNAGIATVTVGSIMEGVLAIYGTTNDLLKLYWYVGAVLIAVGILLFLFHRREKRGTVEAEFVKSHRR